MDHSYLSERVKALQRELAVAEHNRQYFANKYPIPRTGRAIRSCGSGFIKFALSCTRCWIERSSNADGCIKKPQVAWRVSPYRNRLNTSATTRYPITAIKVAQHEEVTK